MKAEVSEPVSSGPGSGTGNTPLTAQRLRPQGPKGLLARAVGVLMWPRATYGEVSASAKWFGILILVVVVSSAAVSALMATDVGRNAIVDLQITQSETYGRPLTQPQIEQLERMSSYYVYLAPVLQGVYYIVGSLVVSGAAFAVFTALLGGEARFKQVFAVVSHSAVVLALQQLFAQPLAYARESLTSPTTLGVFLPFLDEASFLARLFGAVDLFVIWWTINLAIGLGVLYGKRSQPIAVTLLLVYGAIAVIVATVKTAMSGA
jgi:hypothetical protein